MSAADKLRAQADVCETKAANAEDDESAIYFVAQMDALRWAAAVVDGQDAGELPELANDYISIGETADLIAAAAPPAGAGTDSYWDNYWADWQPGGER